MLRLRGTVYFHARFSAPWGMDIAGGEFANFHFVSEGSCWVRVGSGSSRELTSGDVAIFPHGDAHTVLSGPSVAVRPAAEVLATPVRTEPLTFGGPGEPAARMLCGHFELDRTVQHPLITDLPTVVILSARGDRRSHWIKSAMELAAAESEAGAGGASLVADRMAEALLLKTLQWHFELEGTENGFCAALEDPPIAESLRLLHAEYAYPWSVDELASRVHLSRSVFATRFKTAVGFGPIHYLRRWRMLRARERLRHGETVMNVARSVGYRSDVAFAKAFKRTFGLGPGATRSDAPIGRAGRR